MHKLLAFSVVLATTATIHAESLEEKKYWKGEMDYINKSLKDANEQCGVTFTFAFDNQAKLRTEAEKKDGSPSTICNLAIDEVDSLCRAGDDGKAAVKAKIKGFTCGYSKPRSLDLKGGILKYTGNLEEANFSDWAKPWLEKHL
jgi:hypothetical protein